jgi:signal transduction histidine kinase
MSTAPRDCTMCAGLARRVSASIVTPSNVVPSISACVSVLPVSSSVQIMELTDRGRKLEAPQLLLRNAADALPRFGVGGGRNTASRRGSGGGRPLGARGAGGFTGGFGLSSERLVHLVRGLDGSQRQLIKRADPAVPGSPQDRRARSSKCPGTADRDRNGFCARNAPDPSRRRVQLGDLGGTCTDTSTQRKRTGAGHAVRCGGTARARASPQVARLRQTLDGRSGGPLIHSGSDTTRWHTTVADELKREAERHRIARELRDTSGRR